MDREQGEFTRRWNKFFKRQSAEDERRQEKHLAILLKDYSRTPNPTPWEQIKFVFGAVVFWVIVLFIAWTAGLTELPSPLFHGWKKATLGLIDW
jgi:hypothetical protein